MKTQLRNFQFTHQKEIAKIIQKYVNHYKPYTIIDPFCGVPYVLSHIKNYQGNNNMRRIGSDINPYIISMLKRFNVQSNYIEPVLLTRIQPHLYKEMYEQAQEALKQHIFLHRTPGFPNWYIGCGLILGSKKQNFKNGYVGDEEYTVNRQFFIKHGRYVKSKVTIKRLDYQKWEQLATWKRYKRVIYCNYPDPPKQNNYNINPFAFDYWFNLDEFLTLMEFWSEQHVVIISGKQKPNHFQEIWEPHWSYHSKEKLFVHERWVLE